jgi:putative membrane protein
LQNEGCGSRTALTFASERRIEAMMYGRGYDYGYGGMMYGGWLGIFMMVFFGLLLLIGVVLLVVWAMRASSGHGVTGASGPSLGRNDDAIAIARRRYAAGEIDKEQFEQLMRSLGG